MASSNKTGTVTPRAASAIAQSLNVRLLTLDEFATMLYIHAGAFKAMASAYYPDEEVAAFASYVYSNAYADLVRGENMLAGYIGEEMVATAGWAPADDNGVSARIRSVYVRPLFTGTGIGRRLALEAEAWARRSGFKSFGARVPLNAVGFFEALGYEVTSHGVHMLPDDRGLPVSFMRKTDQAADHPVRTEESAG